jgi:cytochrome P450
VIPASFWYLLEILRSDGLLERTQKEIKRLTNLKPGASIPDIDPVRITNNALLESIYAETLRLHVMSLITRSVKQEFKLSRWLFPKDNTVMISSNVEHMSPQWRASDGKHSPEEFWADRFLVHPEEEQNGKGPAEDNQRDESAEFSLEGRQGMWLPFGMGEHMCPGRHFAKQEVIINFVVLVWAFDLELLRPSGWHPADKMDRYGFGTQQPLEKTPFRIRRRQRTI